MRQIILISGIIIAVITLLMYVFQRHLIYFPSQERPILSHYQIKDMQVVHVQTHDGISLTSWYKPAQANQPTFLYLHGNAGNIGNRMLLAKQFIDVGFGLLLLEYRGYGGNKGQPTEQGLYEDGRAGLRFLHQQGIKPEQIVLYGESLGTGIATRLATENNVCAVVLQSPYTSLSNLAHYHYPWVWFNPWDKFDSLSRIDEINAPLLILHSKEDGIVPYSHGIQLFRQAREPKKMLSFDNVGHNDIWDATDFTKKISDFIKRHCDLCVNLGLKE